LAMLDALSRGEVALMILRGILGGTVHF